MFSQGQLNELKTRRAAAAGAGAGAAASASAIVASAATAAGPKPHAVTLDGPEGQVNRTTVGADLGLDLPSSDPRDAIAEISRRKAALDAPGVPTQPAAEVVAAKREAFMRTNSGYWLVNFANVKLATQCFVPNLRLLDFVPTLDEALRLQREWMRDKRVTSRPDIVPANFPFLIPYSETTAQHARHTLDKIERIKARHVKFVEDRFKEFQAHQAHAMKTKEEQGKAWEQQRRSEDGVLPGGAAAAVTGGEGYTAPQGLSDYHRRKRHLMQRQIEEKEKAGTVTESDLQALRALDRLGSSKAPELPAFGKAAGAGPSATGAAVDASAAASAAAVASAGTDFATVVSRVEAAQSLALDELPDVDCDEEQGGSGVRIAAAAATAMASSGASTLDELPEVGEGDYETLADLARKDAEAAEVRRRREGLVDPSVAAFQNPDAAPAPTLSASEIPEHWLPGASGSGNGRKVVEDWPRDLEPRRGRIAVLAFLDDTDSPRDDPTFPEAAGNEPLCVLFGGKYDSDGDAEAVMKSTIGVLAPDLALDAVSMFEWLYPTEVDPDLIREEHRTSTTGMTAEQNTLLTQRKKTLQLTAEARAQSVAMGVPLVETNVNELPDVCEEGVKPHVGGMTLIGDVVQLDEHGNVLSGGFKVPPPQSSHAGGGTSSGE